MPVPAPTDRHETIGDMWNDYLELLARDAAAVEYEAPLLAARARGESAEVVDQLERGKRLALQVRETLVKRRRREDELAALYETADDLARLSDLDSVLQAIVHRARLLLRTDIAYLTMNDPERGDTYMRVTDGSTSARFQQVRLAMGEGLGGRVAQNAMPYATSSYFEDARFNHTHGIDSAVAEEGLVAILGVPLQLGKHVIGVLYAANRSERPFARAEVALLGSLAAHASAAIDKARLLDETRMALAELRSVNVLLKAHSEAVERASDAHDRMTELVLRGGGVEDVALALVEVIGGSLLVVDEAQRRLAEVGRFAAPAPEDLQKSIAVSRASGRAASIADATTTWWVAAVTAGPQHLGAIVLRRDEPLDDADQRILERAALVTALLLLSRRAGIEAENKVRGDLLDDLLRTAGTDAEGLLERARRLGTDLTEPHAVFVVASEGADRLRASNAVDHLAARRNGLSGVFEGRLVLVLPEDEPGAFARTLAEELRATLSCPVTVGGAGPARGIDRLVSGYAEAARCVTGLRALGRTGEGAAISELGFVGLVLGDRPDVAGFVTGRLGALLDYDRRRGTDLLATLRAYFDSGCNLARTREALHVHVNTVTQRLDRIGQLIGADWQDPDRQLELQLALRLHRISSLPDK
ncbi:MAG TPA: helix-turn-helix domain-containing protein [Nocardioidaceae bacterium]|nr:helix-turn-helix domain-containing protein [Nocardioidaceae bacterium]